MKKELKNYSEKELEDALFKKQEENRPKKSITELQSDLLDEVYDRENQFFYSNDNFNSLIMTIRSSKSLDLKEVTKHSYIEETENNQVICRCLFGGNLEMKNYNDVNPIPELVIVGSRQINRMDGIK